MGFLVFIAFGFGGWCFYEAFKSSCGGGFSANDGIDGLNDYDSVREAYENGDIDEFRLQELYDSGVIDDIDLENMCNEGTLDWNDAGDISSGGIDFDDDDCDGDEL